MQPDTQVKQRFELGDILEGFGNTVGAPYSVVIAVIDGDYCSIVPANSKWEATLMSDRAKKGRIVARD